jgi:REP element-mobilizing transposase RayT
MRSASATSTTKRISRVVTDDSGGLSSGGAGDSPAVRYRGWHKRSHLPHCDQAALVQSVNFRLIDSLPGVALQKLEQELAQLSKDQQDGERRQRLEAMLDAGNGECLLARPECAEVVAEVLHYEKGYELAAWVIMPNHVHALVHVEQPLERIVQAWKSISSHKLNRLLGRRGSRWQTDYWDRYMRDEEHFLATVSYIEQNPVTAGLVDTAAHWLWSSANDRGRVARAPRISRTDVGNTP